MEMNIVYSTKRSNFYYKRDQNIYKVSPFFHSWMNKFDLITFWFSTNLIIKPFSLTQKSYKTRTKNFIYIGKENIKNWSRNLGTWAPMYLNTQVGWGLGNPKPNARRSSTFYSSSSLQLSKSNKSSFIKGRQTDDNVIILMFQT